MGAPRIHRELRILGVDVSERTVSRLLAPHPRPRSQTWKTFLTNHLTAAAAVDFFTVPTLTGRVLSCWSCCRIAVGASCTSISLSIRPRRGRLNKSSRPFRTTPCRNGCIAIVTASTGRASTGEWRTWGITEVVSAPASPWQNPFVERLIGSIRRECLDHMIVLNAPHLRRILTIYSRYYHRSRTHLGLEKDAPDRRPVSPPSAGPIIAVPEVGGLHHRYERQAA